MPFWFLITVSHLDSVHDFANSQIFDISLAVLRQPRPLDLGAHNAWVKTRNA